jgi:hypothetical protein
MAHIQYDLDELKAMSDFGNEWAKELYKEKKAYLEELNKNQNINLSDKLVEEFRDIYESKYKDDEKYKFHNVSSFIHLFSVICSAIDNGQIKYKSGREIIKEYIDKDKLSNSNVNKLHLIEEGGIVNEKYKEGNILKCKSELKLNSNNKYEVETKININDNIDDKIKRALIKSIIEELNKIFDDNIFYNTIDELGKQLLSKQLFESMINTYEYDINPSFTTYQGLNLKPKKHTVYKEKNIFKCKSELKLNSKNKYEVETIMNINYDISSKIKRALINSLINGLNQNNVLNKNLFDYFFVYERKNE